MAKKKTSRNSSLTETERLGKRLSELRKAKGYTNSMAFALDNGINPSQYARYESGSANMTYNVLVNIIDALGVTKAEFFSEGLD